jgi:hypothetical protein
MQRMYDNTGQPLKELKICFPCPVRIRFEDGTAVVAIMQDIDGAVRMGNGKVLPSLESATDVAYGMVGIERPRTREDRAAGTMLWTINVHGVSVTYANLDIDRVSAFTASRHPNQFPTACVDTQPINNIVQSGMFVGKVERMLKKQLRPSHIQQLNAKRKEHHSNGKRKLGKKSLHSQPTNLPDSDEDEEETIVVKTKFPHAASDLTARIFEDFVLQNRSRAPILKTIDDVVFPYNGFGVPRLHITVEHPKTRDDIKLFVTSTVLLTIPAYAGKLNDFNSSRDEPLW